MEMKQFFNAHLLYPNMIYPIPSIQQAPKFVPIPMPVAQSSSLEVKLHHFKNRAIQFFLDLFGLFVVYVSYGILISSMAPYTRNYSCDRSGFNFPLVPEFIPVYAILIYGIIGPISLIILVEMFNFKLYPGSKDSEKIQTRFKKFLIITLHTIVLFAFGVGVIILLTAVIQRWTSKLRPNFLAVCLPLRNLNCLSVQVGPGASGAIFNSLSTGGTFCTGSPSAIYDARLSFPSFHASFSSFTMVFLVIYLQARLVSLRFRSLRPLLQVTALTTAFVTSVSRYIDYNGDGWDITAGIVLGSLIAIAFTIYTSRVIWEYQRKPEYSEFNLLPGVHQPSINMQI